MIGGFRLGKRRSDEEAGTRTALKDRIAALLVLGENDVLTLSEIVCHDPGCPGVETVVLLLRGGHKPRAYKMAMAMADVGEAEIEAACKELSG